MRQNRLILLLITCICVFSAPAPAQENNYITSKYDFIPGEKVIFFDDFTSESIGDFPAQWLTNGSGEIVTLEKYPGKWLHITKMGYFIPEAKEDFTENFTIEFDFIPLTTDNNYEYMYSFTFYLLTGSLGEPGGGGEPGDAGFQIYLDNLNIFWKNWSMQNEQRFDGMVGFPFRQNEKYHVALWVQKQRVRMYANENKVLDVPRAIPAGSIPNIFRFESDQVSIPLISNFRIAAGLPDMRNRLLKDGKIISYGIQFDVNSDKLKPESFSTLKVIADILKEDPSLRLQVVGHTDSDGDDASNLDLSKRRGASVKNELVNNFGVDAARLETDGKGESEPIADNNSAVNKAKNRRVEFISIKDAVPPPSLTPSPAAGKSVPVTSQGDNKTYKTVIIGTQTWMAENLSVSRFRNGDPVPEAKTNEEWIKASPAWCYYENDPKNEAKYGRLYNWYAIVDPRGLAPEGWRIPVREDWESLSASLGGIAAAGTKMRSTGGWGNKEDGTNESGFSGLPGGMRHDEGSFTDIGSMGFWWSATENDATGNLCRTLNNLNNFFGFGVGKAKEFYGFSVRCIKE
ncbi:MAG: FISUMP domain-containing protein [Bacteroidota bacterium]